MFDIPKEHRAAVCERAGQGLTVKTVPTPQPKDNEVLIKVLASSLCLSDGFAVEQGGLNATFPLTPGHEIVGRLISKGSKVSEEFKEGSLVGVGWNGGYCHQCLACRLGDFDGCEHRLVTGYHTGGGHQEYTVARWEAIVRIPEETGFSPAELAPLLCAGISAYDGIKAGGAKPGDVVIIQGLGGIGHLAIQIARKSGYHVVAISSSDSKKELALKLGAHDYFNSQESEEFKRKYGGAKLALATAPSSTAISSLLPLLSRYGVLTVVGIPHEGKIELSALDLVEFRRTVRGVTCGCSANNEELIKFAAMGTDKIRPMIQTFTLDDAAEAYESTKKGASRFRNVIVFDEST